MKWAIPITISKWLDLHTDKKKMKKNRRNCKWKTRTQTVHVAENLENRLKFFCLSDFQSHHPLRLLLFHVNYIQL